MNFIADLEPYLVQRWLAGDDSVATELIEGFWDRQYVRKFGLPRIPGIKWPPVPQPDPSPELVDALQNDIAANVIGFVAGDPEPQPNRPPPLLGRNLVVLLANKTIRLKSAKAMRERTLLALKSLDAEIASLAAGKP